MNKITWKYVKPLKEANSLKRFELKNAVEIPEDLKQCILENNGGRPSLKMYDTESSRERVFKALLSYNEEDIETIYRVFPLFRNDIGIKLLPFAADPSGNYICIDFENSNSVVLWLHEIKTAEYIAGSFTDFLGKLY